MGRFLQDMLSRGDDWAARLVERLRRHCGGGLGDVWNVILAGPEEPAPPSFLTPGDDTRVAPDDRILLAGRPSARGSLADTTTRDAAGEYVLRGRAVPSGWLWQRLTGRGPPRSRPAATFAPESRGSPGAV
jgi:hypothetical protein